ncbi:MAG: hypothetical protein OHK0022_33320 [Roseiflexaceae bacterium]
MPYDLPFPPYTRERAARRFPDSPELQRRLTALAHALYPELPAPPAATAVSRATWYRWYQSWRADGIDGLRGRTPVAPVGEISMEELRKLAGELRRTGPIALGCQPAARRLLPQQPDPLERGRLLAHALEGAINAIDAERLARYGVERLLHRTLVEGESVKTIAFQSDRSASHIYQLLQGALGELHTRLLETVQQPPPTPLWMSARPSQPAGRAGEIRLLSQLLEAHGTVALIGESGIGKSALAALLAERWSRAGWNVVWCRVQPDSHDPLQHCLEELAAQLAVLQPLASPQASQRAAVLHGLSQIPILLVLDDAQHLPNASLLDELAALPPVVARLLLSQRALPIKAEHRLDALPASEARALHEHWHGPCAEHEWQAIFRRTGGLPGRLKLAAPGADGTLTDMAARLRSALEGVTLAGQRALLWLNWWDLPLPLQHHAVIASGLTPTDQATLVERGLLTVQEQALDIHGLVREALPQATDPHEQQQARLAVATYAEAQGVWAVAYRCAAAAGDWAAQLRISATAGHAQQQASEWMGALSWWRLHGDLAGACGDQGARNNALLGQADCHLAVFADQQALGFLEQIAEPLDPAQRWRYAFLLFQAYSLANEFARAEKLLADPLLALPAPDGIPATLQWQLQYEIGLLAWRRDWLTHAWRAYLALPHPPPEDTVRLLQFYTLGAAIALDRADFRAYRPLSAARWQIASRRAEPAQLLEEQVRWARVQYELERFPQAARLFATLRRRLSAEDGWWELRRRVALYQGYTAAMLGRGLVLRGAVEAYREACAALQLSDENSQRYELEALDALLGDNVATALALLEQASTLTQLLGQEFNWVMVNLLRARVLISQGRLDEACRLMAGCFQIIRTDRRRGCLIAYRRTLADWLRANGEARKALPLYTGLATRCKADGRLYTAAEGYGRMSECALALGRTEHALAWGRAATELLAGAPDGVLIGPQIWLAYARAAEATGDPAAPAAYATAQRHHEARRRQNN